MHYVAFFGILEVNKKKECLVKSCRNREEQGLSKKGKVRNNSQLPRNKKTDSFYNKLEILKRKEINEHC